MNTYWENKGKYQKDYDTLFKQLVPEIGNADTVAGEVLRAASNLYYDIYNNGGCNIKDCYKKEVLILKAHLEIDALPEYHYREEDGPTDFKGWERLADKAVRFAIKNNNQKASV